MILTTKSKYAVAAIVSIATNQEEVPITLASIATKHDIPLSYLEQIFAKLRHAEIVQSVKGPGGGYFLNAASDQITVASIIDAMDENLKMTRCAKDKKCRKNGVNCQTHDLWKGLGNLVRNYFTAISVSDVIAGNVKI